MRRSSSSANLKDIRCAKKRRVKMERKRRDRPQVVLANRKKRRSSVRKDITDYMVSTVYRLLSRTRDFANSTVTAASIITPTPSAPELFNFLSPESISNPFSLPLPFSPVFPVLLFFFFFSSACCSRKKQHRNGLCRR